MTYFLYFSLAAVLALLITPLIKALALKMRTLDAPTMKRKIHKRPLPLLGGLAVFLAFVLALAVYLAFGRPDLNIVPIKFFGAIILGGLALMAGGALDDKFNLPPKILWLFPALASLIVVGSGIGVGIKFISNPFGHPIYIGYNFSAGGGSAFGGNFFICFSLLNKLL